jgi:uncharacterized protein
MMEPDLQRELGETEPAPHHAPEPAHEPGNILRQTHERNWFDWTFVGPHGLRAGWSILLFYGIYYLFRIIVATVFFSVGLIREPMDDSPGSVLIVELIPLLALIASAGIMALLERRHISSYNLRGPRRARNFAAGAAVGFAALSLLAAALVMGGWLRFDHCGLPAGQALRLGVLWACAFLLVGSVEEGLFRCYGLFTLARGINFWWALAAEAVVCADAFATTRSSGAWGVYLVAALGLIPCFALHQKRAAGSAFWQAAWVTSSVFGLYHTENSGENWIGVFAAAAVGFVFCLSVRFTGSAMWAIGFHAAWDWAETFFYGTPDSGLQGQGHLLTSFPAGNPLWSGGADGPEGSLLVLGVILLVSLFLLVVYGRGNLPERESLPAQ